MRVDHEGVIQPEQSDQIFTLGELFVDGAIDRLRGDLLVLWHEDRQQIGTTVTYKGRIYAPANLDPRLEQLLRLPAEVEDYGSIEHLVADLRKEAARYGLDGNAALLAAVSIMGTWVAESLPGPLVINATGPAGTDTALLELMACLCRRAMRLAEPSVRELARLPEGLAPTILARELSDRALRRLVAATGEPGTYILSGGRFVHFRCPMVVYTYEPVSVPALAIPLLPATGPYRRMTGSDAQDLASKYQPRLLAFRLTQHRKVASSQFDVVGFCPETRTLARILGSIVEGAPDAQNSVLDALASLDEQRKVEQSQAPPAAVLEALLVSCHMKSPGAYLARTTDLANGFLAGRGENIELSAKAVGAIFRRFGLLAQRRSAGYELTLDQNTQRRVHRLAHTHGVLLLSQPATDCAVCQEMLFSTPTDAVRTSGSATAQCT